MNKEYLRRNRLHAASVGVYYGIKSMLGRIENNWSKKPLWLVSSLKTELEKSERVHKEMAVHRNETPPNCQSCVLYGKCNVQIGSVSCHAQLWRHFTHA